MILLKRAQPKKARIFPVLAVVGSAGPGAQAVYRHGVDCIFSAAEEAVAHAKENVQNAAERAMRALKAGMLLAQRAETVFCRGKVRNPLNGRTKLWHCF